MRKLTELRNFEVDPELSLKFRKNKLIENAINEINEKNELVDLVDASHKNAVASNNKLKMFDNEIKVTKAKLMEQEILNKVNLTEQGLVSVLTIILETAIPKKNQKGLELGAISNLLVENLGVSFFANAKSNTFRSIIEAATDMDTLEDAADDINSVAKVLQTKIKEAINTEKENVIAMQEKTNELIEKNKYQDPETPEADPATPVNDTDDTEEPEEDTSETDSADYSNLDSSMDEYSSNFKESTFDKFMKNLLVESLGDDALNESEDDYSDIELEDTYESDDDDSEFDESLTDFNEDLLDDLDSDELDTELDKLLLDEEAYDTSELSEEDLDEIGMDDEECDELEENTRFAQDSKFDLIMDDKFKTKIRDEKTLFESLLISLSPKFLNEAEGTRINETQLINEAVLSYTILEMFHTFKLVDFSNGRVEQLKNKITSRY